MKFECLFKQVFKSLSLQFSHFMGSFCHLLQAFPEGYKVLKNRGKVLKSVKKVMKFCSTGREEKICTAGLIDPKFNL